MIRASMHYSLKQQPAYQAETKSFSEEGRKESNASETVLSYSILVEKQAGPAKR
jgi:hypothetical protein